MSKFNHQGTAGSSSVPFTRVPCWVPIFDPPSNPVFGCPNSSAESGAQRRPKESKEELKEARVARKMIEEPSRETGPLRTQLPSGALLSSFFGGFCGSGFRFL